jgi:hypothetical protein
MEGGDGLDQDDPCLFCGRGVVVHAAGYDKELSGVDRYRAAVGVRATDAETTAKHEEHLVFCFVGVPGELSLDLRYLDELIVDLTHNPRRPKLVKSGAREFEGDGFRLRG